MGHSGRGNVNTLPVQHYSKAKERGTDEDQKGGTEKKGCLAKKKGVLAKKKGA
jgi:hypothetical protein